MATASVHVGGNFTPRQLEDAADKVIRTLVAAGYQAFKVGGCVRDRELGIEPHDFDVATNALSDEVKHLFPKVILVGESFQVIDVVDEETGIITQVATFRQDGKYTDGRRPEEVQAVSDFREDALRRDFTINGMGRDIDGNIIDHVGGLSDLRSGILRAIGDPEARIAEDKLRMLRAIRFAAKFGFTIEPSLMAAIRKHAVEVKQCSGERIRQELEKILTDKNMLVGVQLLLESGLMEQIAEEVTAMGKRGGEQSPKWHPEGNTLVHTLLVMSHLVGQPFLLVLAALLHDIGKPGTQKYRYGRFWGTLLDRFFGRFFPKLRLKISNNGHAELGAEMAAKICGRLKMSVEETKVVVEVIAHHMTMHTLNDPSVKRSTLVRYMSLPYFEFMRLLQHADALGTGLPMAERLSHSNYHFFGGKKREFAEAGAAQRVGADGIINGAVLMGLKLKPGPLFKVIIDAAYKAQQDGEFADVTAATAWVNERLESFQAQAAVLEREREAAKAATRTTQKATAKRTPKPA